MNDFENLMKSIEEVDKFIWENCKRGTPSFTQRLYEEQIWRKKMLEERDKKEKEIENESI